MRSATEKTARTSPQARTLADIRVAEAMHEGVLTCPVEAPLAEAARIMASERVHCVVVVGDDAEERSPWGIVSDLDLVAGALVRDPAEQTAGASAASPVVTVGPDDTLLRAAQLMTEHAATHLVVVDPQGGLPLGVLSTLDVAGAVAGG